MKAKKKYKYNYTTATVDLDKIGGRVKWKEIKKVLKKKKIGIKDFVSDAIVSFYQTLFGDIK